MSAIWGNDGAGWKPLERAGFPDEATLHSLIEETPQLLPLSGSPQLVILGREVQLGSGYADLVAVEPSGQLAIVEIKLARNSESRRAVIAQILTYAAYLDGMDVAELERDVLGKHLSGRGFDSLQAAAQASDQSGSFRSAEFDEGVKASLKEGRFRLVIVLDAAPPELVRLVGYLERAASKLSLDLITVSAYQVQNSQVIVPQRVEPERFQSETPTRASSSPATVSEGVSPFVIAIDAAPVEQRDGLRRLAAWATRLEQDGLVKRLLTWPGKGRHVIIPELPVDEAGLVSISSEHGGTLWMWRSVFQRRAPAALARLESLIAPVTVKQGNSLRNPSQEVLDVIREGYQEAIASIQSGSRAAPTAGS